MRQPTSLSEQTHLSGTTVRRVRGASFLRAIGDARLITPLRSPGGHRRYSRYQLRIAARARELVDQGTPIEAACRIIILEDQLEEAQRINAEHRRAAKSANPTAAA
ncbi:MerR family transcriptional regulator [Streptomyces achmelvichensis]|uniref:MerR family transcriptional regulator n=1 Tax=Streptomyces achmelvichensis TaxID=3134111 RepID=UPI003C12C19A